MSTQTQQFDTSHWIYRFIAYIIDAILAAIIASIITAILLPAFFIGAMAFGGISWLVFPFIFGVIQLFYYLILDVYWGATIGKRLLGLQVQTINGAKIDFGKAFIRNISKIHPLLLLLDWVIGIATPGADNHQKYSDRIAGTTVVSTKQPFTTGVPPPPPPPPPT